MTALPALIVVGYAKVPGASAAHTHGEYVSIVLRVDPVSAEVTDVDSTAVTSLVQDWIRELLLGRNLHDSPEAITSTIDATYLGHAAGAIKQAVTDAWRRFHTHRPR